MKEYVVWPEYFSANLSRKQGRRVSKSLATTKVRPEVFLKACAELNWGCRIEEGKYPRTWFESYGFKVIIALENKIESKHALIKALASKLKEVSEKLA
ncbi:MAG: signal recognition particle subunit SRP19/SEC65 family protein [Thermoprotei archaeon]